MMKEEITRVQEVVRTVQAPAYEIVSKGKLDLLVLNYMAQRVHTVLRYVDGSQNHYAHTEPLLYMFRERHARTHRIVLYRTYEQFPKTNLLFVGFISKKRQPLSTGIVKDIHDVDKKLLEELLHNPGILSYSSLEFRNGNWCNLVLFNNIDGQVHIRQTETHAYAARQLAPLYYEWIRLHNGIVVDGLARRTFVLQKTRHYIFSEPDTRPLIHEITYSNSYGNPT